MEEYSRESSEMTLPVGKIAMYEGRPYLEVPRHWHWGVGVGRG